MNFSVIQYILGTVLCFEGVFLLAPAAVAAFYTERAGLYYLGAALFCFLFGLVLRLRHPKSSVFYSREGFLAVTFSWIVLSMAGAMPMYLTGE